MLICSRIACAANIARQLMFTRMLVLAVLARCTPSKTLPSPSPLPFQAIKALRAVSTEGGGQEGKDEHRNDENTEGFQLLSPL